MFDIAGTELLLLIFLALVFVAPKDLPKMMRALGAFVRKARLIARDFQTSLEDMANEADIAGFKKEAEDIKKQASDIKKEVSDGLISPSGAKIIPSEGGKKTKEGGKKLKKAPKKDKGGKK